MPRSTEFVYRVHWAYYITNHTVRHELYAYQHMDYCLNNGDIDVLLFVEDTLKIVPDHRLSPSHRS